MKPLRTGIAVLAVLLVLVGTARAAALPGARPVLVVEPVDGSYRLWVELTGPDGDIERRLVRQTDVAPVPGATGWDPTHAAAFATWTEGGTRWTSFSQDGGQIWSEARSLNVDLRLLEGAVSPGQTMPPPVLGLALPETGRLFLVQFHTLGLPEWRAALTASGAEVLQYFPMNAHVVRMSSDVATAVRALDFVERIEPYHPSYRLEPELKEWLLEPASASSAGPGETRVRVMAFEWGPTGKERIRAAAEALGARVAEWFPSGQILELYVDREQLRAIAAHDEVMWIDRWSEPGVDMDLVRQDSGADWLESGTGNCGQGVRGEVMDVGVEQTHKDFDGIVMHTAADVQSHGTSTFGIVFGNGARDGDGNAQGTGHMPCKEAGIFADYGYVSDRFAHTQQLKAAPYFASFQSNSWGDALTTSYNSVSSQMDDIIWRLDIAITQSQSNNGSQLSRPQAWAKNIISVGGVYHYNTLSTADDCWCSGASIGPAADGRIKPDVNYWYDSIYTTTTGNSYTTGFGGTSAATPEVAGVLGLMVKMWSDNLWGTNPTGSTVFERQPHASTIKALLVNNAKQYTFTGSSADLSRNKQGWGRPNVQVARDRAARSFVVDWGTPLAVGQSAHYDVEVAAGETELKVTMIYPDPPGTTSASLHRINDLSLKVTSPSGTVYHGNNGLSAGNYSIAGGSPNIVDTVENVFVQNPAAGLWSVEIRAAEINQDAYTSTPAADAVFSLVVTGAAERSSICGNGVREPGEACDGSDLGGQTCTTQGCSGGTLGCTATCTLDRSACTGCPACNNNGTCEMGEDCNVCPSDCMKTTGPACGNDLCEPGNGEDCLSCPQDCNGAQGGKPTKRYCCGDGAGTNPVSCGDTRCTGNGNTCASSPTPPASCCGDGVCQGAETRTNCAVDCGA